MIMINDHLTIPLSKSVTTWLANQITPFLKPELSADAWEDMEADIKFFGDWQLDELSAQQFQRVIDALETMDESDEVVAEIKNPLLARLKSDPRYQSKT